MSEENLQKALEHLEKVAINLHTAKMLLVIENHQAADDLEKARKKLTLAVQRVKSTVQKSEQKCPKIPTQT